MTRSEHLLVILMEECMEFAKDASKSLRFSPDSNYDGVTNREKLQREYNDILGTLELLEAEGIHVTRDENLIQAKINKIECFLEDSKRIGTLK